MKKTFLFVLGLFAALNLQVSGSQAFCSDPIAAKYESAARELYELQVLRGNPDGSCGLNNKINRIEFAVMAMRFSIGDDDARSGTYDPAQMPFPDLQRMVSGNGALWFKDYAATAYRLGILKGAGDGNFYPANQVNAAEAAVISARATELPVPTPAAGQQWYEPVFNAFKANGVEVYPAGTPLTRGQVVLMLYQINSNYEAIKNRLSGGAEISTAVQNTANSGTSTNNTGGTGVVISADKNIPLRFLVENFGYLNPQSVANAVRNFNQSDLLQLSIYRSFGSLIHYVACQAEANLVMTLSGQPTGCAQTTQIWTENYAFFGGNEEQIFMQARREQGNLLISIKCSTGEIDRASCGAYLGAQGNINAMMYQTNQQIIDSLGSGSCSTPNTYLPDGSFCAIRF